MIDLNITFNLPKPWNNETFSIQQIGTINYMVGANGTGKSQFAEQLKNYFNSQGKKCRLLSADRLAGMGFGTKGNINNASGNYVVSHPSFHEGYNKSHFMQYKQGAEYLDTGADVFILLEEKLDLKIKIEAILSQVLNRDIRLEWEDGKLKPMTYNSRQGSEYELKKESHGIKELLVLLTHLYDDSHQVLIIDEPELNLHPQYQAFLLEHIRKVAGNPDEGKKIIYLITHSPFILDFQTIEDLKSVICFHDDFRVPSFLHDLSSENEEKIKKIIPHLNVHHKQLFFAETPIFVEGIFDAQFIKAVQEKREVSIEGAGSTIIDVGGNENLSSYFLLSKALGKKAIFLYDLDSIFFSKQLNINAEGCDEINQFLIGLGLGENFKTIKGTLWKSIDAVKKELIVRDNDYKHYIDSLENDTTKAKKESYTLLIYLIHFLNEAKSQIDENQISLLLSQLRNLINAFKEVNVYILPDGAMENYFPNYTGSKFHISEDKKREVLEKEIEWIFESSNTIDDLKNRFGNLFEIIEKLPIREKIDYKKVLESNLKSIIFKIQKGLSEKKIVDTNKLSEYIGKEWESYKRILDIGNLSFETETFDITLKNIDDFNGKIIHITKDKNYANTSFLD